MYKNEIIDNLKVSDKKETIALEANDYCIGGPYETAGDHKDHDVHIILYHWKTCPPCKAFVPIWKDELLPKIRQAPSRIFASTCERDNIPEDILIKKEIKTFPTIMILYGDQTEFYNGPRTADDIYNYLLDIVNRISKNNLDNNKQNITENKQLGGKSCSKKHDIEYYKYKYLKYKTLYKRKNNNDKSRIKHKSRK